MRKRNIKVNFYLNENEKNILNEIHKKAKLSQSDFLRYLIINYQNKNLSEDNIEDNIEDINNSLSKVINNLLVLKNRFDIAHNLKYSNFVAQQINTIKEILDKF